MNNLPKYFLATYDIQIIANHNIFFSFVFFSIFSKFILKYSFSSKINSIKLVIINIFKFFWYYFSQIFLEKFKPFLIAQSSLIFINLKILRLALLASSILFYYLRLKIFVEFFSQFYSIIALKIKSVLKSYTIYHTFSALPINFDSNNFTIISKKVIVF